jgi:phage/plasmid-like protein (TIGR03299 family)
VLYRSDTHEALSVVSSRYHVVQPSEIMEFYRDLTEISGFQLETAGVLKGGRKLWALARTGQSATIKNTDQVNAYVLLATACDGTLATTAQFTTVRVVCNNTLAVALRNQSASTIKIPHNTKFNPDFVKQELGIAISGWDEFMYSMKQLSERKVSYQEAEKYVVSVISDKEPEEHVKLSTGIEKILTLFRGEGKGSLLSSSKGTAFGLLNAVTEYIDHSKRSQSQENRLDSAWFGIGANVKQKALDQALVLLA